MNVMDPLLDGPLASSAAAVMMVIGAAVLARGLRWERGAIALDWTDPRKPFALMSAFRVAIVGLCVAVLGLSWATHQLWLAIIALIVLGEETFESTMALAAMRYTKLRRP